MMAKPPTTSSLYLDPEVRDPRSAEAAGPELIIRRKQWHNKPTAKRRKRLQ